MAEEKHAAGLLSHEQQTMWRMRHRDKLRSLGPEEKRAFNKRLRRAVEQLPAPDLAKLRVELQAAWDALPADRRAWIQRRFAKKGDN